MIMAEQDELAAHRNTDIEDEEIAILEELPQEITESYGLVFTHSRSPGGNYASSVGEYTITSPGLTAADEDAVWGTTWYSRRR